MSRPGFGTDGIRGVANVALTPGFALALGRATVQAFEATRIIVGRDTRRSGPLLQSAFAAGAASQGAEVLDVGVAPTAMVAYLAHRHALAGVVISASHNPFADNGFKLFGPDGKKIGRSLEERVEAATRRALDDLDHPGPSGGSVGTIERHDLSSHYEAHLENALGGRALTGLSIVIDCANGAASERCRSIFERAGAKVELIAASPDGMNINDHCGATTTKRLRQAVVAGGYDLGLAFDGDADRLVAVDDEGQVVDGDALLTLFALDYQERGLLDPATVVITVMANLGMRRALASRSIGLIETPVGDRFVATALEETGAPLGGEQSGHIILSSLATTGDGILSGLVLCDLVARSGERLSVLATDAFERVPQLLVNVVVHDTSRLDGASEVWAAVERASARLGATGRVLLRASGTEPQVRVMVEAIDGSLAQAISEELVGVVERSLGGR